ncbi:MAG: hypothetical protein V7749_09260 [Cocleimonas sp.]
MNKRSYEMGYTPPEFKKALLGQFDSNTPFVITELRSDSWSIEDQAESILIEISIAVGPPRKIAMLTLPVLNTDFHFKQITETQQKEFMKKFFKYFHKGGG